MAKNGRGFIADLLRLGRASVHLDTPYNLNGEQAVEWQRIVDSLPADFLLPAQYPRLSLLCQHIVESRRLNQSIRAHDMEDAKGYLELLDRKTAKDILILELSEELLLI